MLTITASRVLSGSLKVISNISNPTCIWEVPLELGNGSWIQKNTIMMGLPDQEKKKLWWYYSLAVCIQMDTGRTVLTRASRGNKWALLFTGRVIHVCNECFRVAVWRSGSALILMVSYSEVTSSPRSQTTSLGRRADNGSVGHGQLGQRGYPWPMIKLTKFQE